MRIHAYGSPDAVLHKVPGMGKGVIAKSDKVLAAFSPKAASKAASGFRKVQKEEKVMQAESYSENLSEKKARKAASTPGHFSAYDLAAITGKTRQAIVLRADKEKWSFEEVPVRGGRQKLFALDDLPVDLNKMIRIHFGEIPPDLAECVPPDLDQARIAKCSQDWDAAVDWQRQRARDRKAVLDALELFQIRQGKKRQALDRFVELYREHDVPGMEPSIYQRIKKISRSQLYAWIKQFADEGIAGLISEHGSNRGTLNIPEDQRDAIKSIWSDKPHLGPARIARNLAALFNGRAVSERQVAKFLRLERLNDPQAFEFCESPDRWRSKYMLALGSASEKAEHFLHWVEVDSTSADVMCIDNKRYTVLGLIDVFSRKCKFLLSPTSNSWGIAGLLYATCMDWGIPENLMRDNGQDYASRMTNVGLSNLGVKVRAARPFNPQEKPHIERMFGTLTRDLFEILPGYVGHSVADRKKIEDRKSFAARMAGRQVIQLGLTVAELQERIDHWTEQVYHQRRHGSLGASPNAQAASVPYRPRRIADRRALDILLARPAGGGDEPTRIVRKKGLQYDKGLYWGDDLIDWIGKHVLVRLDLRDAGRLFCFDPETKKFIGDAWDMALSGMSVGDKVAAQKRAAKIVRKNADAMKTAAKPMGDPFAEEFEKAKRKAKLRNLPVGEPVTGNPFIDAAMQAADLTRKEEEEAAQQSRIFPDAEAIAFHAEPEPLDPKVVRFVRQEDLVEDEAQFNTARERLQYCLCKQRTQELTKREIRLLLNVIDEWWDYADQFEGTWSEADRRWLREIAPDHFPQLAQEEIR